MSAEFPAFTPGMEFAGVSTEICDIAEATNLFEFKLLPALLALVLWLNCTLLAVRPFCALRGESIPRCTEGADVPGACWGRPLGAVTPVGGGAACDTCAAVAAQSPTVNRLASDD
jgi:hypothetical protein